MAFATQNAAAMGDSGFSIAKRRNRRFLRVASGYPAVLEYTLEEAPERLTVEGAEGGVGTSNSIFRPNVYSSGRQLSINGSTTTNGASSLFTSEYMPATAGKTYTVYNAASNLRIGFYSNTSGSQDALLNHDDVSTTKTSGRAYTAPAGTAYIRISAAMSDRSNIEIIVDGIRYKIPLVFGTAGKIITLYSPQKLNDGDFITADLTLHTANLNSTDITAMQDFAQDMTLPKANELSVTADTAVEPSSIEVEYYSKRKG